MSHRSRASVSPAKRVNGHPRPGDPDDPTRAYADALVAYQAYRDLQASLSSAGGVR